MNLPLISLRRSALVLALALALPLCASATTYTYRIYRPGLLATEVSTPLPSVGQPLALTLNLGSLPAATRATAYSYNFAPLLSMTGDSPPTASQVTWSASGAVPDGLSLSSSGALSGTPTTSGSSSFQVTATYTDKSGQQVYGIMVNGQPLDVVQISAGSGSYHTCALTTAGAAKCWGSNGNGQLGDGTTIDRYTPVTVSGLSSGVASLAVGNAHTCAVTTAGVAKCWGFNAQGQLGDGTTTQWLTPVAVSGLSSGVASVAAGGHFNCAVTTAGAAKCWGFNGYGQLGDGTTVNSPTPVAVSGLSSGVASLAVGGYHTCALTTAGAAKCWGYNSNGQLGNGSTGTNSATPVAVSGLSSGVASVAGGYKHTCAVTMAGAAKCWGYNNYGQLGDGTTSDKATPVAVSSLSSGVAKLTGGFYHTCALTTAGAAKCWGYNAKGQLGDGTTVDKTTPVAVAGLSSGVVGLVAGNTHTCAVTSGTAKCWGFNAQGQLGNGTSGTANNSAIPVTVSP